MNMDFTTTIQERFYIELNNKQYYTEDQYNMFLYENNLTPMEKYNKSKHERQLLTAVLTVLETLANDIDIFRSVTTEFATSGEAYKYLQQRILDLNRRISNISQADTSRITTPFI